MHTILLVDDDAQLLSALGGVLRSSRAGAFTVLEATTARWAKLGAKAVMSYIRASPKLDVPSRRMPSKAPRKYRST